MEGRLRIEEEDSSCGIGDVSYSNTGGASVDARHITGTVHDKQATQGFEFRDRNFLALAISLW